MNKTEYFKQGMINSAMRDYMKFIEANQNIVIISVNVLKEDSILLTYKEQ
ncbi:MULTISPECIES: hypothetical protein [Planococcus]|nr:hypothetical protein [Planococcus sp. MSAK28401]